MSDILSKSLAEIKKSPPHTLGVLAKNIDEDPFEVRPVVDKALREGLIKQFNGCFRITPSGSDALKDSGEYRLIKEHKPIVLLLTESFHEQNEDIALFVNGKVIFRSGLSEEIGLIASALSDALDCELLELELTESQFITYLKSKSVISSPLRHNIDSESVNWFSSYSDDDAYLAALEFIAG